jgi:hypothetical protein
MVPLQESTKSDLARIHYWIETSWTHAFRSVDWSLGYAFGTYSSRFLTNPRKDAVGIFSVSTSKKIIGPIVLSWNAALPAAPALANRFWMSLVFSF